MIDPWGRVIEGRRLDSGERGVIDALLPQPVGITPYGRFGDLFFWLMVMIGLAPAVIGFWQARRA